MKYFLLGLFKIIVIVLFGLPWLFIESLMLFGGYNNMEDYGIYFFKFIEWNPFKEEDNDKEEQ